MITQSIKEKLIKVASVLPDEILKLQGHWFILNEDSCYSLADEFKHRNIEFTSILQTEIQWWLQSNLDGYYIEIIMNIKLSKMHVRHNVNSGVNVSKNTKDRIEIFEYFLDAFLEIAKVNNVMPNLKEKTDKEILVEMVKEHGIEKVVEMLNEAQSTTRIAPITQLFELELELKSEKVIEQTLREVVDAIFTQTGIPASIKNPNSKE